MSDSGIGATVLCISALFAPLVIPQQTNHQQLLWAQTPRFPYLDGSGLFQWCKRAQCLNKRSYENFYEIENLRSVNKSDTSWEINMGMWSSNKVFILLSAYARSPRAKDPYYEFQVGVWHPRLNFARAQSAIIINDGWQGARPQYYAFPREQPWLLTWKEYRPFVIRITKGGIGQNVTLEAPNIVLMRYRENNTALDIKYISFASIEGSESKVFFDCPSSRYGTMKYLPKNFLEKLGRTNPPTCRPDLCQNCPNIYFPVCSTAQKTYRNECFMQCQKNDTNVKVLHKGTCMHWLWQV